MSSFSVLARKIRIEPHPDADSIELAVVDGYISIVRRGEFQTGDVAVYIPEQSIVPISILTEMNLLKRNRESGEVERLDDGTPIGGCAGSRGDRVKAIRLRGVLSQGLIYRPLLTAETTEAPIHITPELPVEAQSILRASGNWIVDEGGAVIVFCGDERDGSAALEALKEGYPEHRFFEELVEGADYGERLGISKWVPPVPVDMAGKAYACARIETYTDIENVKRFPGVLEDGEEVVASEKAHGTCSVMFLDLDGAFHVSSKGMAKQHLALENELDDKGRPRNAYWRSALAYEIPEKLVRIAAQLRSEGESFETITLYGETIGVQDLMYGLQKGELSFAAFDLKVDDRYLDFDRFALLTDAYGIPRVPVLYRGPFSEDALWEVASGKETFSGEETHVREGVVVRPVIERRDNTVGRVCLKFVSDAYLLRKNADATEFE